jgi:HEAT repeat protein
MNSITNTEWEQRMTEKTALATDLSSLIPELGSPDRVKRKEIRQRILQEGKAAIPALSQATTSRNREVREEAAKALGVLKNPAAAPALINALEDDNFGVRWSAMEGMIALGQSSLKALLDALRNNFDSVRLREGARRILRVLNEQDGLDQPLTKVLEALESIEPEVKVPWAAEAAWKSLSRK